METNPFPFFATCPKGIASVLVAELTAMGAQATKEVVAGVHFGGPLAMAYKACLWSRTANHILLPIARAPVGSADQLYRVVRDIVWDEHLGIQTTFLVEFTGQGGGIDHSQFGAQKVKDAIVDWFRNCHGDRPSVDKIDPGLRIHVHIEKGVATISLGLSGRSLHERGYRTRSVAAPMKENLAAAILLRLGWERIAAEGGALVDPMCGSATLLIEGAWMAGDVAPGLLRSRFGLHGWSQFDNSLWDQLISEAHERAARGLARIPPILGFDHDPGALRAAHENIMAAGLSAQIQVEQATLEENPAAVSGPGLVVVNPPYGERLGKESEVADLYRRIGHLFKTNYTGWHAGVFTAAPEYGKRMGLRARRSYALFNGALPCKLLCFEIYDQASASLPERDDPAVMPPAASLSAGAAMFANRLRKNLKTIGGWAQRESVSCFRLYDADMPEYAFAIDVYSGDGQWIHVQEYAPPPSVSEEGAEMRRVDALLVIPEVLEVKPAAVFYKTRRRQKDGSQYQRLAQRGQFVEIAEGGARFLVNLTDYLDTGIFLDHRLTRVMLGQWCQGKRFLNLFAYTATASVQAALGGARETTSVDMSNTYLEWAQRNFTLNKLDPKRHGLIQADCLEWLHTARSERRFYDVIFLDPPTFSRSKRMAGTLDIQRDHVDLIKLAAALLAPGGILIFSTNLRTFKIDSELLAPLSVENITDATIPRDFARDARLHQCFKIVAD